MLVTKIAKHYIATLTSTPDTKQETPGNIAHLSLILTQASSRSQTQKALSGIKSLVKKKKRCYTSCYGIPRATASCLLPTASCRIGQLINLKEATA